MRLGRLLILAMLALAVARPAAAAKANAPLFAASDPIGISIGMPIGRLTNNRALNAPPVAGTLTVAGTPGETLPVRLSVRGITRRASDICQFPPILVEFVSPPPAGSLFAGQKKLKLATHCRRDAASGQRLLVEYGAYRMLNALTPLSFRVRLATATYLDPGGRREGPFPAFFLEDEGALAKRNGLTQTKFGADAPAKMLSPRDEARTALFEYLIGNVDWAMAAGPAGSHCCHNMKLLTAAPGGSLVPVPYDFDFSGLVDAPYAKPPDELHMRDVLERRFRGYCAFSAAHASEAAAMAAHRTEMLAAFDATPGLTPDRIAKAHAYLAPGFDRIAAQSPGPGDLLRSCLH